MKKNENQNIVVCDIDETLVLHDTTKHPTKEKIMLSYYGTPEHVAIHQEQINLLKSYKARGFFVRAHSNNGVDWAYEVITKLGLTEYVDSVETKPIKHIDDETAVEKIVGQRVYIKP